jgi:transcriptional regulator of acetoin/glycerol metabolism
MSDGQEAAGDDFVSPDYPLRVLDAFRRWELENLKDERRVLLKLVCGKPAGHKPLRRKSQTAQPVRFQFEPLEKVMLGHVRAVLEKTHWNFSLTSKILGIDNATLYRWRKKFKLKKP